MTVSKFVFGTMPADELVLSGTMTVQAGSMMVNFSFAHVRTVIAVHHIHSPNNTNQEIYTLFGTLLCFVVVI